MQSSKISRLGSPPTLPCLVLGLVLLAAGCAPPDAAAGDARLGVVTTVGMIADVARNVGGERVRVTGLMGPGVDPHLFKASEGDVRRLSRADLILFNGLHLEAKMGEVLERMQSRKRVAAVSELIPRERLLAPPEFAGNPDPHIWFDVALWRRTVDVIERELVRLLPEHAAELQANAARYRAELDTLDAYVRRQSARVPRERRVLVTAHDAITTVA